VVEAAYVGNRGVWFRGDGLVNYNAIPEERLRAAGLSLNNPADLELLRSRMDSPLAASRGFNRPPYAGFPLSATVAQSLRPFPQFLSVGSTWAPLGNNWYDSLQMKLTKPGFQRRLHLVQNPHHRRRPRRGSRPDQQRLQPPRAEGDLPCRPAASTGRRL
jgi:hypothetical protein